MFSRLRLLGDLLRWYWRIVLAGWGLVGAYDLWLSQFLPLSVVNRLPRIREVFGMTSAGVWLLVLALILLAATFEYLYRRDAKGATITSAPDDRPIHVGNISSTNQSGGFTGVQIGAAARRWGLQELTQLLTMLPKGETVVVSHHTNVPDAHQLAVQILDFLKSQGIDASLMGVMISYATPQHGVIVDPNARPVTVEVALP